MKLFSMAWLPLLLAGGIAGVSSSPAGIHVRKAPHSTAVSCPVANDIYPCVCTATPDGFSLDMDCSDVIDEAQLEEVFKANFPTSSFRRLTIYQNKNLRVLRDGAFGNTSFEEIWITDGVLTEVQEAALSGSALRALTLVFNMNNLSIFPFTTLISFSRLLSLDLRSNNLQVFPRIISGSLQVLYLSLNPLGDLPVDAFEGTPSLIDLHLSSTELTEILPGTLDGLTNLRIVDLGSNRLQELATNSVQCNSNTGLVDLGYNQIRSVQPNAFPGLVGGWLYIHHNLLTTLEEEVWRPLVENDGYIDPYGNPLLCGCDIAWLVRNGTLLEAVDVYTTCADGRVLASLDPADYDHC